MNTLALTEADWQAQVIDLAGTLGWQHLHVRRSIGRGHRWTTTTNLPGWPDLLLWSARQPGRHLAVELKTDTGRVTPEQERVLEQLAGAGFETFVWRPRDLDLVVATLRAGGGR